jgi:hypothetical protein
MASRRSTTVAGLTLASAFASVLVLAGCGSTAAPSRTVSSVSPDAAFTAKADAICHQAATAGHTLQTPANEGQLAPYFDRALTLSQAEISRLSALHPPADRATAYRTWLTGVEGSFASLRTADAAAKAGKYSQVQAIVREAGAVTERNLAYAHAAGLTTCSKEG